MKQASFNLNGIETKSENFKKSIETKSIETKSIETKSIETKSIESKKNITSTKPIKHVENIYYFRSS
jgi:hypothetical protein